ncbi:MAG TPA: hypothetical protein VGG13_03735 [Candidatus Saccharimonadales bacterium]|jgi:hypothetical protein
MSGTSKDVVYVDVDDEITGIIDKVTSSSAKVIALVLPKRASVFQSIVNMKLLKKRAEVAKKHIVLITSEASLMPLAGNVGLYVAKTLQSKPEVPETLAAVSELPEEIEEAPLAGPEDFDAGKESTTPVGQLAGPGEPSVNQSPEETVELDNSETPASGQAPKGKDGNIAALAAAGGSGKAAKGGKGKKLKVPNFNRFRKLLVFGVLALILLIVLWILAFRVLPKATVDITTQTSNVNASLNLTLDTSATALDTTSNTVPAQTQQQQKSNTEQAPATGKKNEGDKATGSVTMSATKCGGNPFSFPNDVPAGTGISANGLTFITQANTAFVGSGGSGGCFTYSATSNTPITAQSGGSQDNLGSGTSFTVAGRSDVTASGSTNGGTDNIVTVVQQSDIDGAEAKLKNDQNTDAVKQQLEQNLQNNSLYPIEVTFHASKPNISPSVQAGSQAGSVTVTESITYTMFGAKKSDLQKLLDNSINKQIDTNKQSIQDDGLSQTSFSVANSGSGNSLQVSLQTTATIGPHIDANSLKPQIAGKKSGDVKSLIGSLPGVTNVQVHYSPFWVGSAPGNTGKITIKFEKSSSQ